MTTDPLLVEIRTEELPPLMVPSLATEFPTLLLDALRKRGFADEGADYDNKKLLATPRRFAAMLSDVRSHSPEKITARRGPQVAACYDGDGAPTKALIGFMHAVGATCEKALSRVEEKGREYVNYQQTQAAESLHDCLAAIVEKVLLNIPAPRLMRWGDNDFKFIRPVRGVLMMHGGEVICNGRVMGVDVSDHSVGHPVLADGKEIKFNHIDKYEQTLEKEGFVIVDRSERKRRIEEKIITPTKEYYYSNVIGDYMVEDKNADICEYPVVCEGEIDEEVLSLPDYCLIECLIKHQSAFPVLDGTAITSRYQFVIDNDPPDKRAIIKGFNNVVRARLQDALFYYSEDTKTVDKKISQQEAFAKLDKITYHRKLGSQQQRAQRLQKIVGGIADLMKLPAEDKALLEQAAAICKCDLPTLMVQEYPVLEGRVAADYFCEKGTDLYELVHEHNEENFHYATTPEESGSHMRPHDDARRRRRIMHVMKLTVQLEKLVGMFGIGEKASGSKDPHGLRQSAMIIGDVLRNHEDSENRDHDRKRELSLSKLINIAYKSFADLPTFNEKEIRDFILERERFFLQRPNIMHKRMEADVLNAVLSNEIQYITDVEKRALALTNFMRLPEVAGLIEINKRVNNILRKSTAQTASGEIEESLLQDDAEKKLYKEIKELGDRINPDDPESVLNEIVKIKPAVDAFFDAVLVNAPDPAVRDNRHHLLAALQRLLTTVGDLSKLGAVTTAS